MVKLENFELPVEQRSRELLKYNRRMDLRATFLKEFQNPHKHLADEGGHLFDPAIQRYHSMRVSYAEHAKATFRTWRIGMFVVVIPIIALAELLRYGKEKDEKIYRSGAISYRDRRAKFF